MAMAAHQGGPACESGNVTLKVTVSPRIDISSEPPSRVAISFASGNPRPAPALSAFACSPRWNGRNRRAE